MAVCVFVCIKEGLSDLRPREERDPTIRNWGWVSQEQYSRQREKQVLRLLRGKKGT